MSTVGFTPEDLLEMPDGDRFELVDGELVERNMGYRSSRIGGRLLARLAKFVEDHDLGDVLGPDVSFRCYSDDPDKVRKPDVSFVSKEHFPDDDEPEGHCQIVPDLAAEVVSPNDRSEEVAEKVNEYLAAGVKLVWVLYPRTRLVYVHRGDGSLKVLRGDDELSGEQVVPGFRCRVSELFKRR